MVFIYHDGIEIINTASANIHEVVVRSVLAK